MKNNVFFVVFFDLFDFDFFVNYVLFDEEIVENVIEVIWGFGVFLWFV